MKTRSLGSKDEMTGATGGEVFFPGLGAEGPVTAFWGMANLVLSGSGSLSRGIIAIPLSWEIFSS